MVYIQSMIRNWDGGMEWNALCMTFGIRFPSSPEANTVAMLFDEEKRASTSLVLLDTFHLGVHSSFPSPPT